MTQLVNNRHRARRMASPWVRIRRSAVRTAARRVAGSAVPVALAPVITGGFLASGAARSLASAARSLASVTRSLASVTRSLALALAAR